MTKRSTSFGGNGGRSFDDSPSDIESYGQIRSITVFHGKLVNGLSVFYSSGRMLHHGSRKGNKSTLRLQADEFITQISGRAGRRVASLGFTTSLGTVHGEYGGNGGEPFSVDFDGDALLYVFGRAGSAIDRLGFGFGILPPRLPTTVSRPDEHGGSNGRVFDDLVENDYLLGKINAIEIGHGDRIGSITVEYAGREPISRGSGGSRKDRFELQPDEWITEIVGRSNGAVHQLKFVLSSGRHSPEYGGTDGDLFRIGQPGQVVKALFGRVGDVLGGIGAYLENAQPRDYVITDMDFAIDQLQTIAQPDAILTKEIVNRLSLAQTPVLDFSTTVETSETLSISLALGLSVTITYESEVAGITQGVEVGLSVERTVTNEETETRSETYSVSLPVTVAPGEHASASLILRQDELTVPWQGHAVVTYQSGEKVEENISGVWHGVKVVSVRVEYETLDRADEAA